MQTEESPMARLAPPSDTSPSEPIEAVAEVVIVDDVKEAIVVKDGEAVREEVVVVAEAVELTSSDVAELEDEAYEATKALKRTTQEQMDVTKELEARANLLKETHEASESEMNTLLADYMQVLSVLEFFRNRARDLEQENEDLKARTLSLAGGKEEAEASQAEALQRQVTRTSELEQALATANSELVAARASSHAATERNHEQALAELNNVRLVLAGMTGGGGVVCTSAASVEEAKAALNKEISSLKTIVNTYSQRNREKEEVIRSLRERAMDESEGLRRRALNLEERERTWNALDDMEKRHSEQLQRIQLEAKETAATLETLRKSFQDVSLQAKTAEQRYVKTLESYTGMVELQRATTTLLGQVMDAIDEGTSHQALKERIALVQKRMKPLVEAFNRV